MQGVVSGGVWGLVVGGVAAAGISLWNEAPTPRETAAADVVADATDAATDAAAEGVADVTASGPTAEDAPDTTAQPDQSGETQGDTVADAAPADPTEETTVLADAGVVAQVDAPEVSGADAAETTAPTTENANQDAPVQTDSPTAVAPATSGDAAAVIAETETSEPPLTSPDVDVALTAPTATDAPDVTANVEDPVLPNPQGASPTAPSQEGTVAVETASVSSTPAATPEVSADAPAADTTSTQETEAVIIVSDSDETAPITPQSPVSPAPPAASDSNLSDDATQTATPEGTVIVVDDTPVVSELPGGATPGVRVNRIGVGSAEAETASDTQEAPTEFPEGTPASVRYAAPYTNPQGDPELSVILVDDGSFDGAVASVAAIAFPVTVFLNPGNPNSTERMEAYRAAGIEVGILANLPVGARPEDVAVFYEAAFATLPETVAVLDASAGDGGARSDTVAETVAALAEDGRGLVTVSQGLNSSLRIAESEGVPTSVIFRDLDGEGQDTRVIRRFMDQAAFRARQNSGVVLLGQIRGDTISALIQWGAANRASQVAMAPISAVLNTQN